MSDHTRHDVIVFAIRDYADELPRGKPDDGFVGLLWMSADDIADKIEYRLGADDLGGQPERTSR